MNKQKIKHYDKENMQKLLSEFASQIEDAVKIGKVSRITYRKPKFNNIVLTGLGGSAIGGDLLRSYLGEKLSLPFIVNRHYKLPDFVNDKSLVIISSYSGNTEETISAHYEAFKRRANIICISSGGVTKQLAKKWNQSLILIPTGFPPRAALAYSFFPLLITFIKMKLINQIDTDIKETIRLIRQKSKEYQVLDAKRNLALRIAKRLYNHLPIVYSAVERFDAVNLRWRGQIAENAKTLAFGNVFPELNHNELVGWKILKHQMQKMVVIFLRDKEDHHRLKIRMDITKNIINDNVADIIEVYSQGNSLMARMFSLIYLGDWVSFYLAILNRVDPTPVKIIDYLKNELAKV